MVDDLDRYDNPVRQALQRCHGRSERQALLTARKMYDEDLSGRPAPISGDALKQLKFAELRPPGLAAATLSACART